MWTYSHSWAHKTPKHIVDTWGYFCVILVWWDGGRCSAGMWSTVKFSRNWQPHENLSVILRDDSCDRYRCMDRPLDQKIPHRDNHHHHRRRPLSLVSLSSHIIITFIIIIIIISSGIIINIIIISRYYSYCYHGHCHTLPLISHFPAHILAQHVHLLVPYVIERYPITWPRKERWLRVIQYQIRYDCLSLDPNNTAGVWGRSQCRQH